MSPTTRRHLLWTAASLAGIILLVVTLAHVIELRTGARPAEFFWIMLSVAVTIGAFSLLSTWIAVRRTAEPVDRPAAAQRQVAHGDRIVSHISDAILVTDADDRICRVNPAAASLLGYSDDDMVGLPVTAIVATGIDATGTRPGMAGKPRDGVFTHRDRTPVPVSYTVSELHDSGGRLEGRILAAQNVGEKRRVEQRIRYLARTDSLTKLANRMRFQHQLQQSIAHAKRESRYLALLYMDIDRFKDVNDTFGHMVGDIALEAFACRIRSELPAGATAGRLAGDEFGIFLSGLETMDGLMDRVSEVAVALLASISQPFHVEKEEVFITASIGIALYPSGGDNVIDLLRNADAALYSAKRAGGNCFEFYSPDMNTAAVEKLMLKSKLRRSFEREELRMHYQPKYNLENGRVEGVEALVRWDLPDRGLVFPAHFIPLAEETNLILQLGEWVLNQVCRDYRLWQRSLPSPGRVSVNLSLKQLQQQRFIERVQTTFKAHSISPTCLELEITETTLMQDTDRTIRILEALYGMGLHLTIDDFGTGYSSLSALQQFPIGTLKIDRSFVRDITVDKSDATMVKAIIQMARGLQMDIVAEGVESRQQLDLLRELGCDYAQGHLFGDPMTAKDFRDLLVDQAEGTNRFRPLFA